MWSGASAASDPLPFSEPSRNLLGTFVGASLASDPLAEALLAGGVGRATLEMWLKASG